jgi:hypothetical protein
VLPDKPTETPAAIVEALEKKLDQQYPDRSVAEEPPTEAAEDADPGATDLEASNVEPPD